MCCKFAAHFLFEKRRFWTKIRDFAARFLFEKRRFWTKIRDFAAHFLFEKQRFWTKIRDFAAHFLFEKRRSWTKIRDVGRKYRILRLASYLKSADFGRKCAISQPLLDMRPALRAGLSGGSSLGQRPATLFMWSETTKGLRGCDNRYSEKGVRGNCSSAFVSRATCLHQ